MLRSFDELALGGRHMKARSIGTLTFLALAAAGGGCAGNNSMLSTASVTPDKVAVAAPKNDPACVSLASQIDTLRKEGTVDRIEKAAVGKTANVQMKRASLAKQAELNKANADFQTKCGPQIPKPQTAQAAPIAAAPIATAATTAATTQAKSAVTAAAATAVQATPKN